MFLKTLTISSGAKVIREIEFRKGLNLIVDESENQITGNSVGKTTVLKLVDFCLGASPQNIYVDPETKRQEYKLVKDFLVENKVLITLVLTTDLNSDSAEEIVIERNFLARKEIIRRINGELFTEDEFEIKLSNLIFPDHKTEKPTFRQIISHNIRYKDESINNTLNTLSFGKNEEYEALYLFLFGCDFTKGNEKQEVLLKLRQENTFKTRLEKNQTKTAYETALALIENDIDLLSKRKSQFNLNQNFESDLDKLNLLKYEINKISSSIGKLYIRRNLIKESEQELKSNSTNIDLRQLEIIYAQATDKVTSIQKSFEDLVAFHNTMIQEKVKFITKELPLLEKTLKEKNELLRDLLIHEKELSNLISKSESFEELENVIFELNEKYRQKGEFENIVQQLNEVESNLKEYNNQLNKIDSQLFTDSFELSVKTQLNKFNKFFAAISNELYGEQYAIKPDIITNRKNQRLYKFSTFVPFGPNIASGKKQGEISSFDIAYTLFADEENIPCLHFLLNDKKELMHGNQLVKIGNFVNKNNIQFVASILKDKLPSELNKDEYIIVKLSQDDKLLRVEQK